jgi:protocatechuate 3,4-dioxygenase, alpha subunit
MRLATSSQTIGPFWHLLEDASWADLTRFGAAGEVITVEGRLLDGGGAPSADACIEIWQSSPETSELFQGFGRAATDAQGRFRFKTIRPDAMLGPGNTLQAPHIALTIMARGLLFHLMTRLYFAGDPRNSEDPILSLIEDPARRTTLIAKPIEPHVWHIDIHLQGESETVFFEI